MSYSGRGRNKIARRAARVWGLEDGSKVCVLSEAEDCGGMAGVQ